MLEVDSVSSSIPSMWESMLSYLTPAVLFLLLNLTIATIALSSSLSSPKPDTNPDPKSPPSVLQRLRSLNLSPFRSAAHAEPLVAQRSLDDVFRQIEVTATARPVTQLPKKMKRSVSMTSPEAVAEGDVAAVELWRPATMKEGKNIVDDDEVDAKADDFINRFKNQLKLQRMDSIVRYKEMVGRGGMGNN